MKKLTVAAALFGVIAATSLSGCSSSYGGRGDTIRFSFETSNVRLGYADGYWDSDHHWHNWSNTREAREFQKRYRDRYVPDRHTRYQNEGWRDSDNDGIPDRLDKHPNDRRRN